MIRRGFKTWKEHIHRKFDHPRNLGKGRTTAGVANKCKFCSIFTLDIISPTSSSSELSYNKLKHLTRELYETTSKLDQSCIISYNQGTDHHQKRFCDGKRGRAGNHMRMGEMTCRSGRVLPCILGSMRGLEGDPRGCDFVGLHSRQTCLVLLQKWAASKAVVKLVAERCHQVSTHGLQHLYSLHQIQRA
jgi:hypothetical protein